MLNPAHVHLLLNHIPVMGVLFGLLVLLIGFYWKNDQVKRASFVVLVVAALAAGVVYLNGESAEEVVEGMPGVTETVIEPHESAALWALILTALTGVLAILGLYAGRGARRLSTPLTMAILLLVLISGVAMARTANLGGKIRHTEIRGASATTDTMQAETEVEDD